MRPYISIGLKNIRNNKGRTIVTILLSSVSTAILVFMTAFMDGEHKIMLKNAVELYPGYIQITHKNFRDDPSYENLIEDSSSLVSKLKQNKDISFLSQRFETFVLFSSDTKAIGAMISGIQPENEKQISKLQKSIFKGSYLDSDDKNFIYIGVELAKNLKVDIGDTISFVGTGADYSFCADNLVVKGIFQTGLFEFDATSSFVNKKYFDEVFISENLATHIVITPKEIENAKLLSDEISKILKDDLESQSWQEFMSSLVEGMELDSIFGYITIGIFFIVIFFVILIYTLLSVYSRIKEIGILRAIGTKKSEILSMLLFESAILSFISVLIGGIIGAILAYYFSINPIELGKEFEEQFKQYGLISTALPTEFNIVNILRDVSIMFILCVSSTLYPIFKVNSFKPIEAINHV